MIRLSRGFKVPVWSMSRLQQMAAVGPKSHERPGGLAKSSSEQHSLKQNFIRKVISWEIN